MPAGTSKWTTLGSNTDVTINNDSAGEANVAVAPGIAVQVRHECHMWLDDAAAIPTEHFDWVINGDFTVVLNATKINLSDGIGTCSLQVTGSVDGTNYFAMGAALGTTTVDNAVVAYVYDYDSNGRAPYMRLELTPNTDVNNTATPIKIAVIAH